MDLTVQFNQKMKDLGKDHLILDKEAITDNFILFQFAGADTSLLTTTSGLVSLVENPEKQEILAKSLQEFPNLGEEVSLNQIESIDYLQWTTKEILRINDPALIITPRLVTKDFEICGKKIYKGDRVTLAVGNFGIYDNLEEINKFSPERFSVEERKKIPKMGYLPFSSGKRMCPGHQLGELFVKMIVGGLIKNFQIKKAPDHTYKRTLCMLYGVSNPEVLLKPRI